MARGYKVRNSLSRAEFQEHKEHLKNRHFFRENKRDLDIIQQPVKAILPVEKEEKAVKVEFNYRLGQYISQMYGYGYIDKAMDNLRTGNSFKIRT